MSLKFRIKTGVNSVARTLGRRDVFGFNPIEKLHRLGRVASDYRKAYRQAPAPTGPRVVLFNPIGYLFQAQVTGLLAHALALRGARVTLFVCDGIVPQCERRTVSHDEGEADCRACLGMNRTAFEALRLPYRRLSEFVTPEILADAERRAVSGPVGELWAESIHGLPTGGMAYAGTLRYFYQGNLDLEDPRQVAVARQFFKAAAIISHACPRVFIELAPDRVFLVDGVYTYSGLYSHYARNARIPTYVWLRGYRKNTITVGLGGNEGEILPGVPEEVWLGAGLDAQQQAELDDYLESRKTGSQDHRAFIDDPVLDSRRVAEELNLDPNRRTVGVFTNVAWDVAVLFREAAFASADEWLVETIRTLSGQDVQVVVRVHPYEADAWNRTWEGAEATLRRAFGPLPANVRVIPPESKLSSYALMPHLDAGVVFSSKIGMELSCLGKPVLTGGLAFYRGKGFTIDPADGRQYTACLETLAHRGPCSPEEVRRAKAFTHYYFFRRYIPLRFLGDVGEVSPAISGLCDLLPGNDQALDGLCESVLAGQDCEQRRLGIATGGSGVTPG